MIGTGHFEYIRDRHTALVSRMSPSAKHLAFPRLYARPLNEAPLKMLGNAEGEITPLKPPILPITPVPNLKRPNIHRPPSVTVNNHRAQITEIIRVCEAKWNAPAGHIVGPWRSNRHIMPRFACVKLIRDLLRLSMPAIGWALGRRDHTSVLSGYARAGILHMTNCDWRARYDAALSELTSTGPAPQPGPVPAAHLGSGVRPSSHFPARMGAR